jgi:hypothetical protein
MIFMMAGAWRNPNKEYLNNLKPFFRPFGGKRQSRAELTPRGMGCETPGIRKVLQNLQNSSKPSF